MIEGAAQMITQEHLKNILSYDPSSGHFTWIKTSNKSNKKSGDRAGHTHKRTGYVSITIDKKFNAAHRLAFIYMTGSPPDGVVDHINQVRSDNRWCNIRAVTVGENNRNRRLRDANKAGASGVYIDKASGKWEARIRCKGVTHYCGRFSNVDDAIKARNEKIKSLDFSSIHGIAR